MEIRKEVKVSLMRIIKRREKAMKEGGATKNLLGILLESNQKEIEDHGNNKNFGMSLEDVIRECEIFYFAGRDTTSTLLVWTMVLLSKHSNWQERAREEVFQVFGNKKPDVDGISQLKIVSILYKLL